MKIYTTNQNLANEFSQFPVNLSKDQYASLVTQDTRQSSNLIRLTREVHDVPVTNLPEILHMVSAYHV